MNKKYKFICKVVKWFDKINGNTYHSVRVTQLKDNRTVVNKYDFVYGYDSAYEQTALKVMLENKFLPKKYNKNNAYLYQRENNYPIYWSVSNGLKRDMIANSKT